MQTFNADEATRLATFEQFRGLLFSIAYRMLGSVADAEDMLQESFIRWQQACDEEIRSPRAFLITIISRLCINHLQSARVQREEYVGQWLPEPLLTDSRNDPFTILKIDESISMAFLVMLERLTPVERAVFLLHEVFSYRYAEIAEIVGQSQVNCRQILRRARQHVGSGGRRFKTSEPERSDLLEQFLAATRSGNLDGLTALFSREAVLHSDGGGKAIAVPNRIHGAERVARAVIGSFEKNVPKNLVSRIAQVNGERGFVSYLQGKPFSVVTLEVREGRITAVYVVTNPEKLSHLGELPSAPS